MRPKIQQGSIWIALSACLLILVACTPSQQPALNHVTTPPYREIQKLHEFTENFVHVDIVLEQDADGALILASTYSPTEANHHLYSIDLPMTGIDGAGRPTRLELVQENKLHVTSPLFADQPVLEHLVEGFSEPFPIYPDGPVTLRLPVAPQNHIEDSIQTNISVTFMACSSKGRCLPPVVDKQIAINISRNSLGQ